MLLCKLFGVNIFARYMAIANQRQRADPRRDLLAGFVRGRRQRQHRCTIALEALAYSLCVPPQPVLAPLPALFFQVGVQLLPTVLTWNRHHEVPPRITDQSFYLALIVTLG